MEEEDTLPVGFRKRDRTADKVMVQSLKENLKEVISTLPTKREQGIIVRMFGLDGGRPGTDEELAKQYNISRSRVGQIEAKALRRLRHPSRTKYLKPYCDVVQEIDD